MKYIFILLVFISITIESRRLSNLRSSINNHDDCPENICKGNGENLSPESMGSRQLKIPHILSDSSPSQPLPDLHTLLQHMPSAALEEPENLPEDNIHNLLNQASQLEKSSSLDFSQDDDQEGGNTIGYGDEEQESVIDTIPDENLDDILIDDSLDDKFVSNPEYGDEYVSSEPKYSSKAPSSSHISSDNVPPSIVLSGTRNIVLELV